MAHQGPLWSDPMWAVNSSLVSKDSEQELQCTLSKEDRESV